MKSKIILIVAVSIALGVGFFAGRSQASRKWNRLFLDYVQTDTALEAHFWIRALTYLQDEDQADAREFMESRLDGSVFTFLMYEQLQQDERSEAGLRAIRNARDYRSKHPWQNPSPEVRDGVQKVFTFIQE